MNSCSEACPRETVSADDASPGPIEKDEVICRGAFHAEPPVNSLHFNKDGAVKIAVIRNADLRHGTLSVWRASNKVGLSVDDVAQLVATYGPNNQSLMQVLGVEASHIRSSRITVSSGRIYCIVDECETDDLGNKHPAHAHISLCRKLFPVAPDQVDLAFIQAREHLYLLFSKSVVWKAPA